MEYCQEVTAARDKGSKSGYSMHPYGRRNTYLRQYVRHGLGYPTLDWEKSLTVKFRDLPASERRIYSLTLGYGLRGDDARRNQNKPTGISHGHAIALTAKCHELLVHGGRTLEGVFEALGADQGYEQPR